MNDKRLADRIVEALKLAVDQKDLQMTELLVSALEMALTRLAGGKDFVERRDLSEEIEKVLIDVDKLRKEG